MPAAEIEIKPEVSVFHEQKKMPSLWKLSDNIFAGRVVSLKGRRGKKKQKDCSEDVKEASVGESEFLGSADVLSASRCKDNPTSIGDQSRSSSKDAVFDVSVIYFFFFTVKSFNYPYMQDLINSGGFVFLIFQK